MTTTTGERRVTLNPQARALATKINKKFGAGTVALGSEMGIPRRYSTGSLSIDLSLGGGLVGNHWHEFYGLESHGKTAITLKTIAVNQRRDKNFSTLWIASEHYDQDQATALGVDTQRVQVIETQDMPFAFDAVIDYLTERAADCVVIDSYPALIPADEDDKGMDEYSVAAGARTMGKFFRKVGAAGRRDPLNPEDAPWFGIMINQPRDAIGMWSPQGTPTTTPGGKAKNFAYYSRLLVKRAEWIEQKVPGKGKSKVGQVIRTQAVKSKGSPPQRVASVDFFFTDAPVLGFKRGDYDEAKDVFTMAILWDVISRRTPEGAQYDFGDVAWTGLEKVKQALREDDNLREKVTQAVIEKSQRPQDKRTWDEEDVIAAQGVKTVRRRSVRNAK